MWGEELRRVTESSFFFSCVFCSWSPCSLGNPPWFAFRPALLVRIGFVRKPYIRRGIRHEHSLNRASHSPRDFGAVRSVLRWPELGRRVVDARRPVGFALAQHPITCLGQVAGDGDDGASVAFVGREALIEQADVILAVSLDANGAVGGFDKCPLEIAIDVAADAAAVRLQRLYGCTPLTSYTLKKVTHSG